MSITAMGEKEKIYESRQPKQMFDLYEPASELAELYIDGVGQVMLGTFITKLSFYSVESVENRDEEEAIERREIKLRIALPTQKLIEFCLKTLTTIKDSVPQLEAELDNEKNQLSQLMTLALTDNKTEY
jgi:hypothetical protein